MKKAIETLRRAYKGRNSVFTRSELEARVWTVSLLICLGMAVTIFFAILALVNHSEDIKAQTLAEARKDVQPVFGNITSRGPYQGDAANASYRLVTVRYPALDGTPVTVERMMPWNVKVGQEVEVHVQRRGPAYMALDLNKPPVDPFNPPVVGVSDGKYVLAVAAIIAAWIFAGCWFYRLMVVAAVLRRRRPRARHAPA